VLIQSNPSPYTPSPPHPHVSTHPWQLLFSDYNCHSWSFEVLDTYRRLLFIGGLQFVPPGPLRAAAGCMLAILSVIAFSTHPFHSPQTNVLAVSGQYQILLTFLGALLIEADLVGLDDTSLGGALVAVNLVVLISAVGLGWWRVVRTDPDVHLVALSPAQVKLVEAAVQGGSEEAANTATLFAQRVSYKTVTIEEFVTVGRFGPVFKG